MVTQVPARSHNASTLLAIGAAAGLALSLVMMAAPVLAVHSDEPEYIPPAPPTAVDGVVTEWTGAHVFAPLHRAGDPNKPLEANAYIRYDCLTGVVYVWVDAVEGVTVEADKPGDAFVKIDGDKMVDGNSGDDGTPPDFAWVGLENSDAEGFEASFSLDEGEYGIDIHVQVFDDDESQTASSAPANATIPFVLDCPELGSILILKTDDEDEPEPLDGADFLVEDSEGTDVATGTSGDDGDGLFCVDGLVVGDEYTVTETAPPDGYEADPDESKTHTVVDVPDCDTRIAAEDDPDLTFVNELKPVTQATPTQTPPTGGVGAATGTPAGGKLPDTTADGSGMWGALAPILFTLILLGSLGANAYLHLQRASRRNA